ncbi:unnamed protein product [Boreogadus saida]
MEAAQADRQGSRQTGSRQSIVCLIRGSVTVELRRLFSRGIQRTGDPRFSPGIHRALGSQLPSERSVSPRNRHTLRTHQEKHLSTVRWSPDPSAQRGFREYTVRSGSGRPGSEELDRETCNGRLGPEDLYWETGTGMLGLVWVTDGMDQATSLDIEALKVIRRHALPPRGRETHQAASVGGGGTSGSCGG